MSADNFAERFLEKGRELYEAGDKSEILYCLNWCIMNRDPIPDWLARALKAAYTAASAHEIKSWDEVFGKPLKKGKQLATERHKAKVAWSLFWRVEELHGAGKSIDKDLFATVGKEFGVGGTVAAELYYEVRAHWNMNDDDTINRKQPSGKI
jgi:hypothetical protein